MTPTPIPWFTPTPRPLLDVTPVVDFATALGGKDIELAERIVQSYNQFNTLASLETFYALAVSLLLMAGIWSIIRHVKGM